ncbi:hypothetical protein ACFRK5_38265, partial [Streptomyces niveus]
SLRWPSWTSRGAGGAGCGGPPLKLSAARGAGGGGPPRSTSE